jgi:hypothetical protein
MAAKRAASRGGDPARRGTCLASVTSRVLTNHQHCATLIGLQAQFSIAVENKTGSRRGPNQSLDPDAAFEAFLSSLEACSTSAELHSLMSRLLTLVLLNPDGYGTQFAVLTQFGLKISPITITCRRCCVVLRLPSRMKERLITAVTDYRLRNTRMWAPEVAQVYGNILKQLPIDLATV